MQTRQGSERRRIDKKGTQQPPNFGQVLLRCGPLGRKASGLTHVPVEQVRQERVRRNLRRRGHGGPTATSDHESHSTRQGYRSPKASAPRPPDPPNTHRLLRNYTSSHVLHDRQRNVDAEDIVPVAVQLEKNIMELRATGRLPLRQGDRMTRQRTRDLIGI